METPGGAGGRGADRCALCSGGHKGPTQPPLRPWQLHARRARAFLAGSRGGRRPGGRGREACAERRESARGDPLPPGGRGTEAARSRLWAETARAVGTCSPRVSPAPPLGRRVRASPPATSRLPAAAETTPPAVLSAVEPKAKTNSGLRGCCPPQGVAARSPPLLRPPARWGNESGVFLLGLHRLPV